MSFSPEILEILEPSTNEDQNISGCPSSPEVTASPKKRTPPSRRCKVILARLDEDELMPNQASSMVDNDTTPEDLKPDTSQLNLIRYKGSSTRGQFLGVHDYNSYSPPNIYFSDDESMDGEYVPENWLWGDKKQKYEEDREWKPKSKKLKRKKGHKKDSSNNNRRVVKCENDNRSPTEFPNSIMGNLSKRKGKSAESQNTNLDNSFMGNLSKRRQESDAENQNANVTSANSFMGNLLKRRQESDEKQNTNLASANNSFMVKLSKCRVESVENQNTNLMSANSSFLSNLRKRREKSAEEQNTNLASAKKSFMGGNFPKRRAESAENQNNLMNTTKKPWDHCYYKMGRNVLQPSVSEKMPKYLREITDEIVLDMSNSSSACSTKLSESPAMFGFGNEETNKMPKFVPENTSLSKSPTEIIEEYVTNSNAGEKFHHIEAHNDCMYCDKFNELDVLTFLAVADFEENPEVFVKQSKQNAKKMHEILENVQPQGDEVNLKLRMVEKSIDNLKSAKQLLLKHGSFVNVSKSLMKTTSESKIVHIIEEVQID